MQQPVRYYVTVSTRSHCNTYSNKKPVRNCKNWHLIRKASKNTNSRSFSFLEKILQESINRLLSKRSGRNTEQCDWTRTSQNWAEGHRSERFSLVTRVRQTRLYYKLAGQALVANDERKPGPFGHNLLQLLDAMCSGPWSLYWYHLL